MEQKTLASKENEMMVLGCMLSSSDALSMGSERLQEDAFYFSEHKLIFRTLQYFFLHDLPADVHLTAEDLKKKDLLSSCGGIQYLVALSQFAGTATYLEEYIGLMKDDSLLRKMVFACQKIEEKSLKKAGKPSETLEEAQREFYLLGQDDFKSSAVLLGDVLDGKTSDSGLSILQELEKRQEQWVNRTAEDPGSRGLLTGFYDLDKLISGMAPGNLIILAARPSMGKTALAMNIAENVCFKSGKPVGVFSLEMSADQLVSRIVCSQSEIEADKMQSGNLTGAEFQMINCTVDRLKRFPLIMDDQSGLSITDLRSRARRMKEAYDIEFIMIDYLQLLSGPKNKNSENRQNEISEISRMLKTLAKDLKIPILCLSQLSRKVEERISKKPLMSDLRESGSIEQDADVVMMLYREEYYEQYSKVGMAELLVVKNRHGGIGKVDLNFDKRFAKFNSAARI